MEIAKLVSWIKDHKVEQRTIEYFWINIENYKHEYPEEFLRYFNDFNPQLLTVKIERIALMLGNYPLCDRNHIISYVPIVYKNKEIGMYKLLFTLDGIIEDDYFTIY